MSISSTKNCVFLIFIALTIWAYWPSLLHAPKHDQIAYLAEMDQRETVWDKTLGAYSLNRDREFMGRDELLFRPFLNIFLGVQLVVFGYDFTLWQGMAILLHLLVGLSMYCLLDAIRPGVSAAVAAGFFLLMLSNVPMVVWTNVGAYMIFCALVLLAVSRLAEYLRDKEDSQSLKACILLLFFASFIFEVGLIFLLVLSLFLLIIEGMGRAFKGALIAFVLCIMINIADLVWRHPVLHSEAGRIAGAAFSVKTVTNGLTALKWFLTTGIFLRSSEIICVERVAVSPFTLNLQWPLSVLSPHLIRGMIVCGFFLFGLWFSWPRLSSDRRKLSLLLASMAIGFVFFVCLGRVNTRGITTGLFFNSYYIYLFWVLVLPAVYSCLSFDLIRARLDGRLISAAIYFLCGAIIFINVLSVFNVNSMIAKVDHSRRSFLDAASAFVNSHHNESDFSFIVPHTCPGNYAGKWLHKTTDPLWKRYTLTEALYHRYYSAVNPKYILYGAKGSINAH